MNGKLPLPSLFASNANQVEDDLEEQNYRLYPHVRGQWTLFVYIKVEYELVEELLDIITAFDFINPCPNIHLSLLRGHYALRHHQISSFLKSLNILVASHKSFFLVLSQFCVFSNENASKNFLCLRNPFQLDQLPNSVIAFVRALRNLILETDATAEISVNGNSFDLVDFIFHASIAWCKSKEKDRLENLLPQFQQAIEEPIAIKVSKIHVQVGNQQHDFLLQS